MKHIEHTYLLKIFTVCRILNATIIFRPPKRRPADLLEVTTAAESQADWRGQTKRHKQSQPAICCLPRGGAHILFISKGTSKVFFGVEAIMQKQYPKLDAFLTNVAYYF